MDTLARCTFHPAALTVVEADSTDIPVIRDIYAHYVETSVCTMEEVTPTMPEMHRRHDALRRAGMPWLVAVRDKTVIGYAYAGRYRSRIGYSGTVETSIYVHPDHHGCGIGHALLGELIAACSALKLRQMVAVVVGGSSTSGSIRLHESFGFRNVGVLAQVGRKFGQDVDTVLLQRRLVAS